MRRLVVVPLLVLAMLSFASPAAFAASKTQGSPLSAAANAGFGCETRWLLGVPPTKYDPINLGPSSTCTYFQAGTTLDNTHLVPNIGTVTKVRVKSGPNPAPLSVVILRRLFTVNPNNPSEITDATCCRGIRESPVFSPTPNAITEVTVNLPVEAMPGVPGQAGWHDIVGISGNGPGEMPLALIGPQDPSLQYNSAVISSSAYYPRIEPNKDNYNLWTSPPNIEVLMQYDWTDCLEAAGQTPTGRRSRALATQSACPSSPSGPKSSDKGSTKKGKKGKKGCKKGFKKVKVKVHTKGKTRTKSVCKKVKKKGKGKGSKHKKGSARA